MKSSDVTRQYKNTRNGGQEKVSRMGNEYFLDSDWGKGFTGLRKVSKSDLLSAMEWTLAPADVVEDILGK